MRTAVTAPSHEIRRSVSAMVSSIGADIDAVCWRLTDAIHDGVAGLDDDLRPSTFKSTRANVAMIVAFLEEGVDPAQAVAPPEAIFYAHEYARRRLGVERLLQAYRLAHQRFLRMWVEQLQSCSRDVACLTEATTFSSDWLFAWMDTVLDQVAQAYMTERERWVRTSAAIRSETVRAILDGSPADAQELSSRLNYDLQRRHVGLVLWVQDTDEGACAAAGFERLAVEAARALGAASWLLVAQGGLRLDAWVALASDAPDPDLPARLDAAAAAGVRLAVGRPHDGLEGFRTTHEEAVEAHRLARLTHRPGGSCTSFSDVMLSSLLVQDLDRAARFMHAQLGNLAADSDSTRRVASTLKVFLEEGSSFVGAARRIGVHENTIAYRVRRAVELLGRPLDDCKLEVHVALRIHEVLRKAAA